MSDIYVVTFNRLTDSMTYDAIKQTLASVGDWASFAPNVWLVRSDFAGADVIVQRLEPYRDHGTFIFVTKMTNEDWYSHMAEQTIEWLGGHTGLPIVRPQPSALA